MYSYRIKRTFDRFGSAWGYGYNVYTSYQTLYYGEVVDCVSTCQIFHCVFGESLSEFERKNFPFHIFITPESLTKFELFCKKNDCFGGCTIYREITAREYFLRFYQNVRK